LKAELESRGFAVSSIRGVVGPLAWTSLFRLLGLRHLLQRVPGGRFVLPLVCVLTNVKMQIEDALTPDAVTQDNACVYVVVARRPTDDHGTGPDGL